MQQYLLCKKCKKFEVFIEHSSKYCRRCYETRRDAVNRWAEKNREQAKRNTKLWQQANPEKVKAYREKAKLNPVSALMKKLANKEWKQSPKGKEARQRHYQNNKEKVLEQTKNYYTLNKEKMDEYRKSWIENNQDKKKQYSRNYAEAHPEMINLSSKRRRALQQEVVGTFTKDEWEDVLKKYDYQCLKCRKGNIKLTIDHVVPLSRGGTNFITNIQPLCAPCNSSKGTKTIDYRISINATL